MDSQSAASSTQHDSRRYDCPQCGAPVPFRSSISVFAVCEHCRSMVVRKDFNLETFGQMAELPPDLSPLQIGTRGYFDGKAFALIGRLRMHYGEGSWTEWCADFGQGKIGWVAEAMGCFMVSFEQSAPDLARLNPEVKQGTRINVAGANWFVSDIKSAKCIAAEGELPHVAPPGWERTGIDLVGEKGEFGTIEITSEGRAFFSGAYAQFDELNFTELRKVPGWEQDAEITRRQSAAMNCPKCGAPVALRAEGLTMAAVCGSCGSILDSSTPDLQAVGRVSQETLRLNPILPIGTRGMLRGEMWEIIGFMRRKDRWCSWDEYLLFNPWQGFRFLVTFNGHWSLVRILPGHSTKNEWDGETFKLFAREQATTTGVLGEFYWRVRQGEKAMLFDFVSPPRILSCENNEELQDITWSGGEYIGSDEVKAAFARDANKIGRPRGPYLNEPNPHQQKWREVRMPFFMLLVTYLVLQFLFLGYDAQKSVLDARLAYDASAADKTLMTPKFKLEGPSAPLHVTALGGLETDTYLGLKGSLVNAATQQAIPVTLPLTNYTTAPGGNVQDVTLPAVPSGEYYLRLDPDASSSLRTVPLSVKVARGGLFWSNFWFGLFAICLWPVWLLLRTNAFERRRWAESDFNPYASSSDDDDESGSGFLKFIRNLSDD
ncbi:MAG: DUF4178 domain-containing protein [Verrucomicrobiaceae bacterium]|nr:DUF4178 domain-containing protein [Verrucomicrobiaceae bacterium]